MPCSVTHLHTVSCQSELHFLPNSVCSLNHQELHHIYINYITHPPNLRENCIEQSTHSVSEDNYITYPPTISPKRTTLSMSSSSYQILSEVWTSTTSTIHPIWSPSTCCVSEENYITHAATLSPRRTTLPINLFCLCGECQYPSTHFVSE